MMPAACMLSTSTPILGLYESPGTSRGVDYDYYGYNGMREFSLNHLIDLIR